MPRRFLRMATASYLVLATLVQGCASSTMITSIPDGAKVYVDGQLIGRAPVTQKDTAILGIAKTVMLKLDGYRTTTGTIRKEELDPGALVAGLLVIIPLLWITRYPSQYLFELEPEPDFPEAQGVIPGS